MSKYTTEVRFICETEAGLANSTGASNVNNVLENSWYKIFDTSWEIYDEEKRSQLCKKILKHFYTREIGAETVGLWKMWLNQRMDEIMPYYNQMYKSAELEFNPFDDVNVTTTGNRDTNRSEDKARNSSSNDVRTDDLKTSVTTNVTTNDNGESWTLENDTPQGGLSGIDNWNYLSKATKNQNSDTTSSNSTSNGSNTGTQKNDRSGNETENNTGKENTVYSDVIKGKRGSVSYSKLLQEYRETMLNIDMMIIDELQDLFLKLW